MNRDGVWPDTIEGVMWTQPRGADMWTPSIRNDALWAARTAERSAFVIAARAWMTAAIADGWTARPTYGDHEPTERAFSLTCEGFLVQGIARAGDLRTLPSADLHIWGPDGLAITPPPIYDWEAIRRGYATCSRCAAYPVVTERVGFAGRSCVPCALIDRPLIETPGWCE